MALLYDKYAAAVNGIVLRIIRNEEVSQEVVQDIFLKIWDKIAQYDDQKGRLFTWILNLGRNAAIDNVHSKEIKKSTKTDTVEDNVYNIETRNSEEMPTDGIGVEEVLTDLIEDQQFVIKKIYFDGYTHSEVAKGFEIPLGTVKSRLRSALKHLKKKMTD